RVGEGGEPLIGAAIGRDDDRARAVPLDQDLVRVPALYGVEGVETEVVEEEEIDGEELAQRGLVRVVEPRMLELLEHSVGGEGEDGVAVAAREPAERVGEEGLADAEGPTIATCA